MTRVFVVDDDPNLRLALRKALRRKGVDVSEADGGKDAIDPLNTGRAGKEAIDVCVLDLKMPEVDGLEVLRRTLRRKIPVVVLTGHGTVPDAVEAMRLGASNFVQKPVDADELLPILRQAMGDPEPSSREIMGESRALKDFLDDLDRAARSEEPILLLGETGTGKELAARRIHEVSDRESAPFVGFNAAAVPRELFESELFGHKKGAFTGAERERDGLMVEAGHGTLFLDEVGDLPADAQVKLLRALEERKFRPVGSDTDRAFHARVIAATHQDLPQMVEKGRFRADLYYRLSVLPLTLPALRDRGADALAIAGRWLERLSSEGRKLRLDEDAEALLSGYGFPGNIRELINLMKRAAIFSPTPTIDAACLERLLASSPFSSLSAPASSSGPVAGDRVTLEELEKAHIVRLLDELNNVSEVARILAIDRRTLQRKMVAWGLRDEE
jgi:DNA-binding NtrC family response regulator